MSYYHLTFCFNAVLINNQQIVVFIYPLVEAKLASWRSGAKDCLPRGIRFSSKYAVYILVYPDFSLWSLDSGTCSLTLYPFAVEDWWLHDDFVLITGPSCVMEIPLHHKTNVFSPRKYDSMSPRYSSKGWRLERLDARSWLMKLQSWWVKALLEIKFLIMVKLRSGMHNQLSSGPLLPGINCKKKIGTVNCH